LRLAPDRARVGSAVAAFVGLARLAALLLLLLARLLRLLLLGLAAARLALLDLLLELVVFLEADVLALLGLERHAAIAFRLVSTALLVRPLVVLLAALILLLLARILLLSRGLLLLLARVLLLAFVPVLIGHGFLLSIRDGAVERLTLGRAVFPVR
jgi:hypothetical protein